MPKQLKKITVSHISLVKAGANKKEIIYKGDDVPPTWEREVHTIKSDLEKGIIYGIVYAPDEVDTQGDFAKAEDIESAAYDFMKNGRVKNVDRDHTFEKEDAFVCESWIIRKGDAIFPDEKEGSWAVGIKLENESLKKAVKDGGIAGLSMAGQAEKTETKKADQPSTVEDLVESLKKAFNSVYINIGANWYKPERELSKSNQHEGEDVPKEELQKMLASAIEEAMKPVVERIDKIAAITEENTSELSKAKEKVTKHEEALLKSSQFYGFEKKQKNNDAIVA